MNENESIRETTWICDKIMVVGECVCVCVCVCVVMNVCGEGGVYLNMRNLNNDEEVILYE